MTARKCCSRRRCCVSMQLDAPGFLRDAYAGITVSELQASAERQRVQFRAGKFGRARLRLPLRIPGPPAHGDHPGAAGARVQHRPDHDGAGRALSGHAVNGEVVTVENPTKFPNPSEIKQIEEPIIEATVITREEYIGEILKLLEEKRGTQKKFEYLGGGRVMLVYEVAVERNRSRFL